MSHRRPTRFHLEPKWIDPRQTRSCGRKCEWVALYMLQYEFPVVFANSFWLLEDGRCLFLCAPQSRPLHRVTTVNVATSTRGRTRLPTELIKGDTRTNNPFCHLLRGTRHPQLLRNSSISSSSRSMWTKLTVVSGSVSKPLPPNPGRLICPGNYSPTH